MPEPIKKYLAKERSIGERKSVVNQLQNLLKYKEISAAYPKADERNMSEDKGEGKSFTVPFDLANLEHQNHHALEY